MTRLLSHTEIQCAATCEARHAFAYSGHLTGGDTLKPKTSSPHLRDGRAWGRGVAAFHESGLLVDGYAALDEALEEDAEEQREAGVYDRDVHAGASKFLRALLLHYSQTTEPLPITRPEHELDVSIPSRNGGRASTRYRFQAFLDGLTDEYEEPGLWAVEYKLRDKLTPLPQLFRDRQSKRYAWAAVRSLDLCDLAGVIIDERLKEMPKPARLVKAKRKGEGIDGMVPSHAKDQLCTASAYRMLCEEYGVEMEQETFDALNARQWQQRHPIRFHPGELEEVGRELVSAAQLVRDLDSGIRVPIRNGQTRICNGCQFREICAQPSDFLIDMSFERTVPKRLRPEFASCPAVAGNGATDGQGGQTQSLAVAAASPEPSLSLGNGNHKWGEVPF